VLDIDTGTVEPTSNNSFGSISSVYSVTSDDTILYAVGGGTITAFDITVPLTPVRLFNTPPASGSLTVSGNYGYTASGFGGVKAYDLSLPPRLQEMDAVVESAIGSENAACMVRGGYAYVASSGSGTSYLMIY